MDGQFLSKQGSSIRSVWLDVLKAVAMIGVVLVHFNNVWSSPIYFLSKASAIGARCPQLFFIVSAYLTWNSLSKQSIRWSQFYRKRLVRIAPIYYIALIVSTIIPILKITEVSPVNWFSHFLFFNGLNPSWTNGIIGVEWYIADLALFYIFVPVLWRLVQGLKSSLIIFSVAIMLSSISLIVYNNHVATSDQVIRMYFETFFILHQLPVMVLGIVLYYLTQEMSRIGLRKVFIESGAVIGIISGLSIVFHLNKSVITSSLIAGLIFAWIFLLAYVIRHVFEHKLWETIAFVGLHSFGIYCFHQIIINCVLKIVPHTSAGVWISAVAGVLIISVVVGYIADKAQEKMISRIQL